MTIRLAVCGAGGRMGGMLLSLAARDGRFRTIGAVERPGHPLLGRILAGGVPVTARLEELLSKAEVVLDFTTVEATLAHAAQCGKFRVPMVIGTTGWTPSTGKRLEMLLKRTAYVQSPNMSLGVNLLFQLTRQAARALSAYDAEIVEIHHNRKKDAPSGTALRLAEELNLARGGRLRPVFGRKGRPGERSSSEVGILAVRAGDEMGEHTVYLAGPGERLELTHRAQSRETFSRGALEAAAWVKGRPAGRYDMQDVLGLRKITT